MDMLITQSGQVVANRLERRMLDGKMYAVAPATIVVAGVLNGALLPADELQRFVEAWNGRPIPLRHPKRDGEYVSANRTDVIEAEVFGQVLNCAIEGDRLRGELWIDVAKTERLGGDALRTLTRMDRGEIVELSSAYFCDIEAGAGEFNGRAYEGIQRNLRPDHVALLPDEVGACSVKDGCGAPRVNAAQGTQDGVIIAFFVPSEVASQLALDGASLPDGSEVLPASELHVTLAYLGTVDEVATMVDETTLLRFVADMAAGEILVQAEIGGIGRFSGQDGMEPIWLAINSRSLMEFREHLVECMGWVANDPRGFTPHITLAYVPTEADVTLRTPTRVMLAFDKLALAWGGRVTTFALRGESNAGQGMAEMRPVVVSNSCGCKENGMNEVEKQNAKVTPNEGTPSGEASKPAVNLMDPAFVAQVAQQAAAIVLETQKRDGLIGTLKANRAVGFTDADLKGMPSETLQKLVDALAANEKQPDYSGRGGVRTNAAADGGEWQPYEEWKAKK